MILINRGSASGPRALPGRRHAVTAASFKFKYAASAFLVVLLAAAGVVALFLVRHEPTRATSARSPKRPRVSASPGAAGPRPSLAAHAADSIAGAVRAGDIAGHGAPAAALHRRRHGRRDQRRRQLRAGALQLAPRHSAAGGTLAVRATEPVRTFVENIPGAVTPETLAELTLDARAGRPGVRAQPGRPPAGGERRAHRA